MHAAMLYSAVVVFHKNGERIMKIHVNNLALNMTQADTQVIIWSAVYKSAQFSVK